MACVYNIVAMPTLLKQVQESQFLDRKLCYIWNRIEHGEEVDKWKVNKDRDLLYNKRLIMPNLL